MRQEKGRRFLLAVVIIGLLLANLWMLGQQLGFSVAPRPKSFIETMMEEMWQKKLKDDPPLGIEVTALKGFKGRRLVIIIERCTDCVARTLKGWAETVKAEGLPKMVLVTGDKEEQAKQVLDRWQIEAEVVSDPKGEIAKKLHAFFTPRAYAFEDGRLIWKQERINMGAFEAIKEAIR